MSYNNPNLFTVTIPPGPDNYVTNPNVFAPSTPGASVPGQVVSDLFTCDLNADGVDEVLTATGTGIKAWIDDGSGVWSELSSVDTGDFVSVACGDLNGDGALDVVGALSTSLFWYDNSVGNGTSWTKYSVDPGFSAFYTTFIDLDVVDYAGPFGVVDDILVVTGPGSDVPALPVINDVPRNGSVWGADLVYNFTTWVDTTDSSSGAVMGLFGGNADLDFVAPNPTNDNIEVFIGGDFWTRTVIDATRTAPSAIAVGDLNGDSDDDIVVAWSGELVVYLGPLDAPPLTEVVLLDGTGLGTVSDLVVADLNGDGDEDIVYSESGAGTFVLYRTGASYGSPTSLGSNSNYALGDVKDMDGDGDIDIVYKSLFGAISAFSPAENNLWYSPNHVFLTGVNHVSFLIDTPSLPTRWRITSDLGVEEQSGNLTPGGGGASSCCGDSVVQVFETCDDGNADDLVCDSSCEIPPACGNGALDPGEECDEGDTLNGDGCDEDCISEVCGNGKRQVGEQCDDGGTAPGDGCDGLCFIEACGNSIVQAGEGCDLGDTIAGDGCDENCQVEECGNGIVQTGEECDDGNQGESDSCDSNCMNIECGNGIVQAGEDCDDDTSDCVDCVLIISPAAPAPASGLFLWLGLCAGAALLGFVGYKLRPEPEPVVLERRRSHSIAPSAASLYGSELYKEADVAPIPPDQDSRLTSSFSVVGLY